MCFTDGDGTSSATWRDAGIRLTISKVDLISYGTYSQTNPVRTMSSSNLAAATNRLPQVASAAVFTFTGDIANSKWASLVEACTLN